jgi:tRNA pseudouridine55 synthase
MDGIIVVDKEKGLSSHQVVGIVRRLLNLKKVGHVGTLDPLATGVLVVCVGEATKLSPFLTSDDKEYVAEILIGEGSDTEDTEGTITDRLDVQSLDDQMVDDVLEGLVGTLKQLPPMYSAVKINGRKLYDYALHNQEVEREEREITIFDLKRVSPVMLSDGIATFSFRTKVSKGTYIRTLCVEIGKRLGYPALMKNLCRTRSGQFRLEVATSTENLRQGKFDMIPMLEALDLPKVEITLQNKKMIENGMMVKVETVGSNEPLIAFTENQKLVGIYERDNLHYKAVRLWK